MPPLAPQDATGATPLHAAASAGQAAPLRAFLSRGVPVDARDGVGRTPLHCAAAAAAAGVVPLLLAAGADPAAACTAGQTPLHVACAAGLLHVAQLLLGRMRPQDVNLQDCEGWSALHHAAALGHLPLLQQLLASGACPHAATCRGWTAAHLAARGGRRALLEELLARGADPRVADAYGCTTLHFVVLHGDVEMFNGVLEAAMAAEAADGGADGEGGGVGQGLRSWSLRGTDLRGYTVLHYAVEGGDLTIVRTLLAAGLGADECAAATAATASGQEGTGQEEAEEAAGEAPADGSNEYNDRPWAAGLPLPSEVLKDIRALHGQGASPALCSAKGPVPRATALHLACQLCRLDIAATLLVAGYSATAAAACGRRPLHCAAIGPGPSPFLGCRGLAERQAKSAGGSRSGEEDGGNDGAGAGGSGVGGSAGQQEVHGRQVAVAEMLLSHGADPGHVDAYGCTALSYAAGSGNAVLVERLVALLAAGEGGPGLAADRRGMTPLHWASAGGSAAAVSALLAAGARLSAADAAGRTPLHWAAAAGAADAVSVLSAAVLAAGLDLHAPDGHGATPAQLAAAGGHVPVVARLLEAGRAPDAAGAGMSALHLAAQNGLDQVLAQLCAVPGCDVNTRDADSLTPLHCAAARGALGAVRTLLAAGADPNAAADDGLLPLHSAAAGGFVEVVEALLAAGSLASYKSGSGATPLHLAAGAGHAGVCEVLIEAGCPVMGR